MLVTQLILNRSCLVAILVFDPPSRSIKPAFQWRVRKTKHGARFAGGTFSLMSRVAR